MLKSLKKIKWSKQKSYFFGFKQKKLFLLKKKFKLESFCKFIKIRLWEVEEDCLKTVEGSRILVGFFIENDFRQGSLVINQQTKVNFT